MLRRVHKMQENQMFGQNLPQKKSIHRSECPTFTVQRRASRSMCVLDRFEQIDTPPWINPGDSWFILKSLFRSLLTVIHDYSVLRLCLYCSRVPHGTVYGLFYQAEACIFKASLRILIAALWSRSWCDPQTGQVHFRIPRSLTRMFLYPQTQQVCDEA